MTTSPPTLETSARNNANNNNDSGRSSSTSTPTDDVSVKREDTTPSDEQLGKHGITTPTASSSSTATATATGKTLKDSKNLKDPARPRRRKARRACFACQRAHLTCGDERPCQRCIKRNLQDSCQDGVRKKAKYLHDTTLDEIPLPAPLHPPLPPYSSGEFGFSAHAPQTHQHSPQNLSTNPFPSYHQHTAAPDGTINPTKLETSGPSLGRLRAEAPFEATAILDPADPAWWNFDVASLKFGSQYGAMEFGALGNMAAGGQQQQQHEEDGGGAGEGVGYEALWTTQRGSVSMDGEGGGAGGFENTYVIDVGGDGGQGEDMSPSSKIEMVESPEQLQQQNQQNQQNQQLPYQPITPSPSSATRGYDTSGPPTITPPPRRNPRTSPHHHQQQHHTKPSHHLSSSTSSLQSPFHPIPTPAPTTLYTAPLTPHPYSTRHHTLFHHLLLRLPPPLLLRIAKSMSSFRPSFIACLQTLTTPDLVFMERCLQRTLLEYERFIGSVGTPTVVCRRSGEVVEVGREWEMLTGWRRDVLRGERRNRNVNPEWRRSHRGAEAGRGDGDGKGEMVKRPVFLAELIDDDSVVEFYEEFARLAFGDARGSVMTTCRVVTYWEEGGEGEERRRGVTGGDGTTVECAFCWWVKRDVFDIPMLIVGNVSIGIPAVRRRWGRI
ncbi:hypothetical protein EX30DRAFT_373812 [Ascodesmis nigricans]|uniref:Zn(2)-C6 fungal-type domain-containing protein n=1 Tax=Ascodesmis nigricans TaxID=341454 RepID=A0A4S2MMU6_9PEZI|nr:hypothetical protein EX30DRAFT_373812 [Ascodesmis nigricans]